MIWFPLPVCSGLNFDTVAFFHRCLGIKQLDDLGPKQDYFLSLNSPGLVSKVTNFSAGSLMAAANIKSQNGLDLPKCLFFTQICPENHQGEASRCAGPLEGSTNTKMTLKNQKCHQIFVSVISLASVFILLHKIEENLCFLFLKLLCFVIILSLQSIWNNCHKIQMILNQSSLNIE